MTSDGEASPDLGRVKDEIAFFMEKTFQISLGYVGAVIAIVLASRLDSVDVATGVNGAVLMFSGVLVVNSVYLSLAAGTLFAALKRGMYLSLEDPNGAGFGKWEAFVRKSSDSPFSGKPLGLHAWNLDNYYMAPVFVLIMIASIVSFILGAMRADVWIEWVVILSSLALLLVPVVMFLTTMRLANHVARLVDTSELGGDT